MCTCMCAHVYVYVWLEKWVGVQHPLVLQPYQVTSGQSPQNQIGSQLYKQDTCLGLWPCKALGTRTCHLTYLFTCLPTDNSSESHALPELVTTCQKHWKLRHPLLSQNPGKYLILVIFFIFLNVVSQVAVGQGELIVLYSDGMCMHGGRGCRLTEQWRNWLCCTVPGAGQLSWSRHRPWPAGTMEWKGRNICPWAWGFILYTVEKVVTLSANLQQESTHRKSWITSSSTCGNRDAEDDIESPLFQVYRSTQKTVNYWNYQITGGKHQSKGWQLSGVSFPDHHSHSNHCNIYHVMLILGEKPHSTPTHISASPTYCQPKYTVNVLLTHLFHSGRCDCRAGPNTSVG